MEFSTKYTILADMTTYGDVYWSMQLKYKSIYQQPDKITVQHSPNYMPFEALQLKIWHHCTVTCNKVTAVSGLNKNLSNKLYFRKLL